MVERSGEIGVSIEDLQAVTGWNRERARDVLHLNVGSGSIVDVSGRYISAETFLDLRSRTLTAVADLHKHEPLAAGMSRETLRERVYKHLPISTFGAVIAALEIEGKITAGADMVSLSGHQSQLSPLEKNISDRLYRIYFEARLEPTKLDDMLRKIADVQPSEPRKLLQMLVENGLLVKVTEEYYFASAAIDELAVAVKTWADTSADRLIDVARFKDIAGVSRKYAIPLLEYFDRTKVTVRAGDKRVVLR
jgi:Elongation factor SelB, winged helix.